MKRMCVVVLLRGVLKYKCQEINLEEALSGGNIQQPAQQQSSVQRVLQIQNSLPTCNNPLGCLLGIE